MFPWVGGVNTSKDPSTIGPNELIQADHVVFATNGARNMRDGINYNWDSSSANGGSNGETILGMCDFWYGATGTRTNFLMGVGSSGNLYQWNKTSGTRTKIPVNSTATSWGNFNTKISFEVMNNALIYAGNGANNPVRIYQPINSSSATDLTLTSPPAASIMREFNGRLWTNDATLLDRVQYSPPGDPSTWGGNGDSGALDIGVGDGDPFGITAIFPSFQGTLYIAKQTKLYSVVGQTPEDYQVKCVSDGIGCVSHNAVATVDQDDIVFMSENGIHSLVGTINFGDEEDKYLSLPIQGTINQYWTKGSFGNVWGCYLSQINSVAFAVPDTKYSGTGNTAIWLYNIPLKSWYTWPNINCQSLITSYDTDKRRFYIGTGTGRVAKSFNSTPYDVSPSGSQTSITMTFTTGIIYIDKNLLVINGFKRFVMIYGPTGTHAVTVSIKIDNYSTQSIVYTQQVGNSILGVSFVLGSSTLGYSQVTGPYNQSIDGYGRAFQATFVQSGSQATVNIQGFGIEYEKQGPAGETILQG